MPLGTQKPCSLITSTGKKKTTLASSTWAVGGNLGDRTGKALQLEAGVWKWRCLGWVFSPCTCPVVSWNFLHSPVPYCYHAENGTRACADGLSTVGGGIYCCLCWLLPADLYPPSCLSEQNSGALERTLCCAEPPQDCHRAGEAPLCLQNHSFPRQRQAVSQHSTLCASWSRGAMTGKGVLGTTLVVLA